MLNYRNDNDRSWGLMAAIGLLVLVAVGASYLLIRSVEHIDFHYLKDQDKALKEY